MILGYYERLYATKFSNLEEMGKFLEIHNLPRLNYEELKNLNRLLNSEEIGTTIKNLPQNKYPGMDDLTSQFYQTFKANLTIILSNSSKKLKKR